MQNLQVSRLDHLGIKHPKMKLWELDQCLPLNKHLYIDYLKNEKPLDTASKKPMKAPASVMNRAKGLFP